jgi:hypothetical protein
MSSRHLPLIAFAWLVAACSEAEEGPGSNMSTTRTRDAFCTEWAVRACGSEVVDICQASSVEDCRAAQKTYCLDLVPTSYAPDQARACLDAVEAAYLDADLTGAELKTVTQLGPPCHQLVRGTGGADASCESNDECDGPRGFECVIKGGELLGTCQIPEEVEGGFECAEPQQICEDGFYCNNQNCISYRRLGASCTVDGECGPEAYCEVVPPAIDKTCVARAEVGEACSSARECLSEICLLAGDDPTCLTRVRLSPSEPLCGTLR